MNDKDIHKALSELATVLRMSGRGRHRCAAVKVEDGRYGGLETDARFEYVSVNTSSGVVRGLKPGDCVRVRVIPGKKATDMLGVRYRLLAVVCRS